MHPISHITLLIAGICLIGHDQEKFYEIRGTCPPEAEGANYFMGKGRYELMFQMLTAHLFAILSSYIAQVMNHYGYKTISNLLTVAKVLSYLWTIMNVQNGIDYKDCAEVTNQMWVMAWLTYEVMCFYLNIIGIVIFLAIASIFKFRSFREREGFAGTMRKTQDFLCYCREDIHWFQQWFMQLGMFVLGILFRSKKQADSIGLSASEGGAVLFFGLLGMCHIYFSDEKFQATRVTYVLLATTGLLSLVMIPGLMQAFDDDRKWWAPVMMTIIVSHCVIYIQLAIDACTWNEKLRKWQADYQFQQQYANDMETSETALRNKLSDYLINAKPEPTDEMLKTQEDASIICKEEHKLSAGLYTAAFTALMKTTKKQHKMMESQQVDLLWRVVFAFCIQMGFSIVLLLYCNLQPVVEKATEVHVALFFTVLLLHVTCLPMARDGLAMMKYALLHAEEFNYPMSAFVLGFMQMTAMITAEIVNVMASGSKKEVGDAIAGFIGFKCIIDLANIYMNSCEEFPMKAAVGKLSFKRGKKEDVVEPLGNGWLLGTIFKLYYVFYKSVFFYFFPFAASFIPFIFSLEENFQ